MSSNQSLGEAGRAVGRFALDVLYTELMPKGLIDYEPRHLTNAPLVMIGRAIPRLMAVRQIAHAGFEASADGGPMGVPFLIPVNYLLLDVFSNVALWGYNGYKNFYRNLERRNASGKDDLEGQPATVAIEAPYRIIRGVVNIAKRIGGNRPETPSESI